MVPTQERAGYYWNTNDAADLPFNEAGRVMPTHIVCRTIGQTGIVRPAAETIPVAELTLIGVGRFGEARGAGTKWTGKSHKYGVYQSKRSLVILEAHGGGMVGYIDYHPLEAWVTWLSTLSPERVWDMCYMICGTQNEAYKNGREYERSEWRHAAAEKRIKVRKIRGQGVSVKIEPRKQEAQAV